MALGSGNDEGWRWFRLAKSSLVPELLKVEFRTPNFEAQRQKKPIGVEVEAMIARSVLRCSATRRNLIGSRLRPVRAKQCTYSTASSTTNAANGASPASMLAAFTNELDRIAPRFDIRGSQIQILQTPADFYNTLKVYAVRSMHLAKLIVIDQNPTRRDADISVHPVHRQD